MLQILHQHLAISSVLNKVVMKSSFIAATKYLLVLVAFVVKHCEGNDEEHKNSINDVDSKPQILHRQCEITSTIINSVLTSLPVGNISGEHKYGDSSDGESQNDDKFGEIRQVFVIGMLVIDKEVQIEDEHQNTNNYRHNHKRKIEIPHC